MIGVIRFTPVVCYELNLGRDLTFVLTAKRFCHNSAATLPSFLYLFLKKIVSTFNTCAFWALYLKIWTVDSITLLIIHLAILSRTVPSAQSPPWAFLEGERKTNCCRYMYNWARCSGFAHCLVSLQTCLLPAFQRWWSHFLYLRLPTARTLWL